MEDAIMSKLLITTTIICFLMIGAFSAPAEKSTELFIPIGQSPGLSGEYTVMGKIDQIDSKNQSIRMSGPSGSYTVKMATDTFIYLDRSKMNRTNTYGSLADCHVGDTVEVKFKDNSRNKPIEWIKVEKAQ
jgi:hypothetical protein